jgi:hypothetical protein
MSGTSAGSEMCMARLRCGADYPSPGNCNGVAWPSRHGYSIGCLLGGVLQVAPYRKACRIFARS